MYSSFCLTWARSLVFPGEIGPADEFSARLDIEVDSPGPSHVIKCVPIRARSGTARVHAPKDLQVYKHLYSFTNFYTKKAHFHAFLTSQAWLEKTKHNSSKNKKKCGKMEWCRWKPTRIRYLYSHRRHVCLFWPCKAPQLYLYVFVFF